MNWWDEGVNYFYLFNIKEIDDKIKYEKGYN